MDHQQNKADINNDGYKTESVVVVDPVTGKVEEYSINDVPEWIDRVVPERIATDYISWYGAYPHGWWNCCGLLYVGNKDVMNRQPLPRKTETKWNYSSSMDQTTNPIGSAE